MKTSALALSILLTASGCSAQAEVAARSEGPTMVAIGVPRPEGPVVDLADILPPAEEARLDEQLRDMWERTGDALVVVSVTSLEGHTIEDYAFSMFNTWGIGDATTARGLLLLVAPIEREVRIEVGCGFESTVTDGVAAEIIRERILPEFREGRLAEGTMAGAEALTARMALLTPANDPGPHTPMCRARARDAA